MEVKHKLDLLKVLHFYKTSLNKELDGFIWMWLVQPSLEMKEQDMEQEY